MIKEGSNLCLFILVQDYWNYKFRDIDHGLQNFNVSQKRFFDNLDRPFYNNNISHTSNIYNQDEGGLTSLQLRWNSYLSIANMIPKLGILMLNATVGHKVPIRPKLLAGFIGIILMFVLTDVMTKVDTDGFQDGFLSLTLITVVFITSFSGILQVNK